MWMFVLEAAIALALLLFIVWWTMAPVKKREDAARTAKSASEDRPEDRPDGRD